jgi:DNA polymerase III delta subunit
MSITLIECSARYLAEREIEKILPLRERQRDDVLIISDNFDLQTLTQIQSPTLWGAPRAILLLDLGSNNSRQTSAFVEGLTQSLGSIQSELVIWIRNGKNLRSLISAVKKNLGQYVQIKTPKYDNERKAFIQSEFARINKKLDPNALDLILTNFPENLDLLINMVNQLNSDLEMQTVTGSAIAPFLEQIQNNQLFNLSDAITSRNFAVLTRELAQRRGQLNSIQLLGLIRAKLNNLIKAFAVVNSEVSLETSGLNAWYYRNKLLPEIQMVWTESKLKTALDNLLGAYRAILTESADDGYVVERLALALI